MVTSQEKKTSLLGIDKAKKYEIITSKVYCSHVKPHRNPALTNPRKTCGFNFSCGFHFRIYCV